MKKLSKWLLNSAEYFLLKAHGWKSISKDEWIAPKDYPWNPRRSYRRGHAVNATKVWIHI